MLEEETLRLEDDILFIANHYSRCYGMDHQIIKLVEELGELTQALMKHVIHSTVESKGRVLEEMADVLVMIRQVEHLLSMDDDSLLRKMKEKVDRQIKRIEDGLDK